MIEQKYLFLLFENLQSYYKGNSMKYFILKKKKNHIIFE